MTKLHWFQSYSYFWELFNVHLLLLVIALVVVHAAAAVVAAVFVINEKKWGHQMLKISIT